MKYEVVIRSKEAFVYFRVTVERAQNIYSKEGEGFCLLSLYYNSFAHILLYAREKSLKFKIYFAAKQNQLLNNIYKNKKQQKKIILCR